MITEPIMLDKTGKAIVNAILSTGAQAGELKELKEKYDVTILPLHILLGEEEYEDIFMIWKKD